MIAISSNAVRLEITHQMRRVRNAGDRDERLGNEFGERIETRRETAGEDHRLHEPTVPLARRRNAELVERDEPDEARQRELTAPAPRFLDQSVEPFQAEPSNELRRSFDPTRDHVERAADADAGPASGFAQMFRQPVLLARRAHPDEEQPRAAGRDRSDDRRRLVVAKVSAARPRNGQIGEARFQYRGSIGSHALGAAQKIDRQPLRGRARAETFDQLDAGHALAQRRTAPSRDREQSDRIAERERAVVDDCAKSRVALSVDDHLGAERDDLRAAALSRKRRGFVPRRHLASIGSSRHPRICSEVTATRLPSGVRVNGAISGRKRSATDGGIASSGKRHSPTRKPS